MGITFLESIQKLVDEEGLSPENARIEACAVFGFNNEDEDNFEEWNK